jgi:NTE family protein
MKRLAIVIGSGSVMCAASAGLLSVLHNAGISPSMAVGSSAGSMYAALIALGVSTSLIGEMSKTLWTSDLFEGYTASLRSVLSGELRFNELSGLIDDTAMNQRLQDIYAEKDFSSTQIPLFIVSTDLYSGEAITHTSGKIFDAIRASIAIPLVFPPWKIGEQFLVDGAVSNPLPVDVAIKEGADIILAIGFELPTRSRMRSYTAVTNHFNSLYMNNILKSRFAFYNAVHHAEIIPIMPDFGRNIGTFEVESIPYIIEKGEQATLEHLDYLIKLLSS